MLVKTPVELIPCWCCCSLCVQSAVSTVRQRKVFNYDLNTTSLDPEVMARGTLGKGATPTVRTTRCHVRPAPQHADHDCRELDVVHSACMCIRMLPQCMR